MTNETVGGFAGDPAEAFTPPASGGCCGSAPATATATTCCGTTGAATAAGTCCDPAAKADAVADGAGCCG
jgi:hypothetical protein